MYSALSVDESSQYETVKNAIFKSVLNAEIA